MYKEQKSKLAFPLLATIVRLHIMNYVSLSAVIETYKAKRTRSKKKPDKPPSKQKTTPPALQLKIEI